MRAFAILLLSLGLTVSASADDLCGTSDRHDAYLRARHERNEQLRRSRIGTDATIAPATAVRDGVFYVEADDAMSIGAHRFDLAGQSLVFEPKGSKYAVRRAALQYRAPEGTPLRKFTEKPEEWFVKYDLSQFQFPLFGRSISSLYLTAYNGVHVAEPKSVSQANQFDALEAGVQPDAFLSPLAMTTRKPRSLAHPDLYVVETADALVVTWRSTTGKYFGYDVQAELRKDGTIVYSYPSLRNVEWGAPVVTPGLANWNPAERLLGSVDDSSGDVPANGGIGPMADFGRITVTRLGETDLLRIRFKLTKAPDAAALTAGKPLRYYVYVGNTAVEVDLEHGGTTSFWAADRPSASRNGIGGHVNGDVVDMYATQSSLGITSGRYTMRAFSAIGYGTVADATQVLLTVDAAPSRLTADLSALNGTELAGPIVEPFVLPELDVYNVWKQLQAKYALRADEFDGVAIYQSFYTDMIFYAGAYSTMGNPQVEGIANYPPSFYGPNTPKAPALMHMNHMRYGYNSEEKSTSQVLLHEFGHRWLYHANIRGEDGALSRVLNPASAHPAQYVHMPAAFRVYDQNESSTMGGAVFTQEGDGSWKARVRNAGFTWNELYLMGLAAPEEVEPWFYLAGTDPQLGNEYWPSDGVVVKGERRDVKVDAIIAAHGARKPSAGTSQRSFRVLFVLVTNPGELATPEQVTQMNAMRTLLEKNFALATGGRGTVRTTWTAPARVRAVR